MFKLIGRFGNLLYWLAGLGFVMWAWRVFNEFLKKRAVRKSEEQAQSDQKVLHNAVSSAEEEFVKQGKEIDKARDSS